MKAKKWLDILIHLIQAFMPVFVTTPEIGGA
jgi:hypothetical protein